MRGRKPNPPPALRIGDDISGTVTESLKDTGALAEPVWVMVPPADWQGAVAELASAKWHELFRALEPLGTIGPENAPALEMACKQWARWRVAEAQIDKLGPIIRAPVTGVPMGNPFLSVANQAADRFLKLAAELGLTPTMRGRVTKHKLPPVGSSNAKVRVL
jgi:P27 family predicted phage terminase small subunit